MCSGFVLGRYVCESCLASLDFAYTPFCIHCQKESIEGETHVFCKKRNSPDKLIVFYLFKNNIRTLIHMCKYREKAYRIGKELVVYACRYPEQFNLHELDPSFVVCPVPADKKREKQRGFNFSQILAREFSSILNLPLANFLEKIKTTESLTTHTKREREDLVKGLFKIKKIKNFPKSVLLVDDVVTTGSTLIECSKVLKRSGVSEVVCLALCYRPLFSSKEF